MYALVRLEPETAANSMILDKEEAIRIYANWDTELSDGEFQVSQQFADCYLIWKGQVTEGELVVGQTIKWHERPCPQDGCLNWVAGDHEGQVVAVNADDEVLTNLMYQASPLVTAWAYPPYI